MYNDSVDICHKNRWNLQLYCWYIAIWELNYCTFRSSIWKYMNCIITFFISVSVIYELYNYIFIFVSIIYELYNYIKKSSMTISCSILSHFSLMEKSIWTVLLHFCSICYRTSSSEVLFPVPQFLCTALIPKLRPYIPTSATSHAHFRLITVTAIWAFPY